MLVGMDVSHAERGKTTESVAAIVASMVCMHYTRLTNVHIRNLHIDEMY